MFTPPPSLSGRAAREVTCIAASPVANQIAVGYGDGTVRLWSFDTWDCECTFNGHHSAVTALRYSASGSHLASGAQDTDVVLWDVTGESGLFRLRGHRGQITDLAFLGGAGTGKLASSSKDELIKVWDLETQHCCQTVPSRGGEVWSLDVDPSGRRLAAGAADIELRVYSVDASASAEVLTEMGSVKRGSHERAGTVRYAAAPGGGTVLVCQGAGKLTEVWQVRDEAEAAKRLKRRLRRKKEKEKKKKEAKDAEDEDNGNDSGAEEQATLVAGDELELMASIRSKHKVSSCGVSPPSSRKAPLRLALALANNSIEVWETKAGEGETAARAMVVDSGGHRSDVRSVVLSSDDAMCLSTSGTGVKIWNPRNGACLRTIDGGYGLCAIFAPGNNHAVVGTKEGTFQIIDIRASACTAVIEAHAGPVWSLALLPDGSGFVSGSADKDVKFWEWDLAPGSNGATPQLDVAHTRTLTMTDDVLCVRVSPDGRRLAVALLDSTVRVFYTETLKFFLSLYGHKLPVLTMDISSDSTLLVTGSADKNIKIWGLDFGDCHRSLFAHGDSVMAVAFVPGTHYLFTAGKDGAVKYWDADKFEHLLTLEGHHGEVWGLAVSSLGDFVVTGSQDRSLRRWERTDEPFFVEEEKEKRLESLFEADLERPEQAPLGAGQVGEEGASAAAGRKSLETVSAADAIVDALDLAAAEDERLKEVAEAEARRKRSGDASAPGPRPTANPLLLGLTPSDYVLRAVSQVRGAELEQALLMVPFTDALRLLGYLSSWLRRGGRVELLGRIATLLLRLHMQQLMATPSARPVLVELQGALRGRVQAFKDTMGFNMAAMEHLQRAIKERGAAAGPEGAAMAVLPLKRKIEAA